MLVINLPRQSQKAVVNVWQDLLFHVAALRARYLGGDTQWQAGAPCKLYCYMRALFGRKAPKKGQIAARFEAGLKIAHRHSVVDRAEPAEVGQWQALVVRYRDEWCAGKAIEHLVQTRQVDASMQRGQEWHVLVRKNRQVQPVDVGLDDVELS